MPKLSDVTPARSSASTSNSSLVRDSGAAMRRAAGQRGLGMTPRKHRRSKRGTRSY